METKRVLMHGQWVTVKVFPPAWAEGYQREMERLGLHKPRARKAKRGQAISGRFRLNQPHIRPNSRNKV